MERALHGVLPCVDFLIFPSTMGNAASGRNGVGIAAAAPAPEGLCDPIFRYGLCYGRYGQDSETRHIRARLVAYPRCCTGDAMRRGF